MQRMDEAEIREHLIDMHADDGDPIERTSYYAWLGCQFLHAIYVFCGNDAVDEKVLNPWKPTTEIKRNESASNDAAFRAALKARFEAGKRLAKGGMKSGE